MLNWGKILLSIFLRAIYCLPVGCLALNDQLLKERMEEPPPCWMMEQIQMDLAPFKERGVTSDQLSAFWKDVGNPRDLLLVRFKVINGTISIVSSIPDKDILRLQAVKGALERLNSIKTLPNLDFVVTLHDAYSAHCTDDNCPVLTFAKDKNATASILLPDFEALNGYDQLTSKILTANAQYPWEVKLKSAFWRGSSTGGNFNLKNWQDFARAKLVLLSIRNPRDLDARFTSLVQMDNETRYFLSARGFLGMPAAPSEHIRYKYLAEVDGNSCSYSRCYWELLSNSVMLKQVSDNIQWYYGALKPDVHFIPVAHDLSDFFVKLNWARTHDAECRIIAENATEFAKTELSAESTYLYLHHLLQEYAKICHVSTTNSI
ncbi:MAG: glycosyl transferase family 90 [Chlamydiota bacterium]